MAKVKARSPRRFPLQSVSECARKWLTDIWKQEVDNWKPFATNIGPWSRRYWKRVFPWSFSPSIGTEKQDQIEQIRLWINHWRMEFVWMQFVDFSLKVASTALFRSAEVKDKVCCCSMCVLTALRQRDFCRKPLEETAAEFPALLYWVACSPEGFPPLKWFRLGRSEACSSGAMSAVPEWRGWMLPE